MCNEIYVLRGSTNSHNNINNSKQLHSGAREVRGWMKRPIAAKPKPKKAGEGASWERALMWWNERAAVTKTTKLLCEAL